VLIAASAMLAPVPWAQAADITGAGATAPYVLYAMWAEAYRKASGIGLDYQARGSGFGVQQIMAKRVTFGASDAPLKFDQLKEAGLVQFPVILAGVVLAVNLKAVTDGQLVLDGATAAQIYLGTITSWNDERIQKLNPTLTLPAQAIVPVYRADASRNTLLFTSYLSRKHIRFSDTVGTSTVVHWPVGIGTKGGSENVASVVAVTDGAIGYEDFSYARMKLLACAQLVNKAGKRVRPSIESFQAAAASADWAHAPGYDLLLSDQPGEASWPITGASFILMQANPADPTATAEALKFFSWAFSNGAQIARDLDCAPLPANLIQSVRATWVSQIRPLPVRRPQA